MKEPTGTTTTTKQRGRRRGGGGWNWKAVASVVIMAGVCLCRMIKESEQITLGDSYRALLVAPDASVVAAVPVIPPLRIPSSYIINNEGRLVISWSGLEAIESLVDTIWERNYFCDTIRAARLNATASAAQANQSSIVFGLQRTLPITLRLSFGCRELYMKSKTGTGNYLQAIYMMRLAATVLEQVDVRLACYDAETTKTSLILPWLTGRWHWKRRSKDTLLKAAALVNKRRQYVRHATCEPFWEAPIGLMHPDMQYDLRRMSVSLLGTIPNHPSTEFAERLWNNSIETGTGSDAFEPQLVLEPGHIPLLSGIEIDDAVIHFRCGDLLTTNLTTYGFMRFSGYARHISQSARTIGILTQPFEADKDQQQRPQDSDAINRERCRTLVYALQSFVLEHVPNARVTIRNDANETIALTYARMIMANQTVGTMSTFSAFPVVATFGTGYFLRPQRYSPNVWLRKHPNITDQMTGRSNLVLFDEDVVLVGSQTMELWEKKGEEAVLSWFRS